MVDTPTVWQSPDLIFPPPATTQFDPAIAAIGDGRYVVVWTDGEASYGDGTGINIVAAVLDAEGLPISDEPFQVNLSGDTNSLDGQPAVVSRPSGGFRVAMNAGR